MTSKEIRQSYINFFVQKHGHTFVPSSPVVPWDDPTLLFTNAGMNQFKPLFLGQEKRAYTRAVNTQKCIRAGGKHNDLDDVGRSRRHHTFFEMLGNWSFGDYFKQGAIEMSWELLTKVWKLDPTRLHVSCFEGDEKNGVPRDTEAADIWHKTCGVPLDHIHYFGKDNFWEMGETGPCGPCTEIYYDRTPDKTGGPLVNGEDPRVMEIWNNVFIQYNRNADRSLTVLPAQHVDTGMGFERITQVLQNVDSNYSIDLWNPFWEMLKDFSGHTYSGKFPKTNSVDAAAEAADEGLRKDIAFRVIGDHVRCLTFALTDGAVPSNEGRGYVLRRILRRAVRFGRQTLGLTEPFMHKMVDVVVQAMGDAFPELTKNPQRVAELIQDEEVSFGKTLDRGIGLFNAAAFERISAALDKISNGPNSIVRQRGPGHTRGEKGPVYSGSLELELESTDGSISVVTGSIENMEPFFLLVSRYKLSVDLPGEIAFKLHDTYGFPIDLTRIMAEERGMTVDIAGYEKLMEEAREKARLGGKAGDSPLFTLPPSVLEQLRERGIAPTDDSEKYGYEQLRGKVVAIWNGNELVDSIKTDAETPAALILDRTNFYSEMGGQIGDSGRIVTAGGGSFDVDTTRTVGGYVLHIGRLIKSEIIVGKAAGVTTGMARHATEKNHTATHVANWALREVLGDDVQQKGSLVDPEKLRFDFSHNKALSDEEIIRTEKLVNESIAKKLPVHWEVVPQEHALKINGLRAVFGEKYPPQVRVVSIGAPVKDLLSDPAKSEWRQYSIEFCGGTHLANTSDIESFVITSEESVSKGIRRLVALTGVAASAAMKKTESLLVAIESAKSAPESDLPKLTTELQRLAGESGIALSAKKHTQKVIAELQQKFKAWEKAQKASNAPSLDVGPIADQLLSNAMALGGGKVVVANVPDATGEQLLAIMDSLRKKEPSLALMLGSTDGTKVNFVSAVSDDLIAKGLKAGDWIRDTAKTAGGGGGGRPNMAQAGGKDAAKLGEALEVAKAFALKVLG